MVGVKTDFKDCFVQSKNCKRGKKQLQKMDKESQCVTDDENERKKKENIKRGR